MATIITKNSSTASSVPTAAQLVKGELAVNVTDKRLFTEDNSGNVVELGTNPSTLALSGGTANGVAYLNGSKVLTTGSALTFDGTTLSNTGSGDRVKFGTGTRNIYIAGDSGGVSLLDGAGQTGNGWYINGASSYVAGYIGSSEQMRLTSTGLGIGTSLPGYKLSVATTTDHVGLYDTDITGLVHVLSGNGNSSLYIGADNGNVAASSNLLFGVDGTERLRIDSSGNLGLGVTPSAWGSNWKAIQVNGLYGGALSTSASSNTATNLSHSAYHNGTNWIYGYTGVGAARYEIDGPSGGATHKWFTAPSGTAGNAISFTQAMTLDASGNLGIGTSSPGFRLDIAGGSGRIIPSGGSSNTPESGAGTLNVYGATSGITTRTGALRLESYSDMAANAGTGIAFSARYISAPNDGSYTFAKIGGYKENGSSGTGNGYLAFATTTSPGDLTERARIDSSGNLLVGTTSAEINSGVGIKLKNDSAKRLAIVSSESANAGGESLTMYSTGAGAFRFYVGWGGTVYATSTSISAISDQTLKENIRDLETGLTEVMALRPRRFDWKNGDAQDVAGFVAQEVEQVLPELVTDYVYNKDEEGNDIIKKSLKMGDILPTLVKAIQEQQAIITDLRARVAALEAA